MCSAQLDHDVIGKNSLGRFVLPCQQIIRHLDPGPFSAILSYFGGANLQANSGLQKPPKAMEFVI